MLKKKKIKIGIVGCGAIGSFLAKTIATDLSRYASLSGLYDINIKKACLLARGIGKSGILTLSLDDLIKKSDLVIEATILESAFDIVSKVLKTSRDVMVMSVGGIVNQLEELKLIALKRGVNIFIPSGAICGIDGLKASGCGKIKKVTLITTKPAYAFVDVPYIAKKKIRLKGLKKETVIFEGTARQAIRAFPKNINVAATLSLAGIGVDKTTVRIIASGRTHINTHQIEIESTAGKVITRTENIPHPDNPKTSYLAALSAVATLRQILEPVKIGT